MDYKKMIIVMVKGIDANKENKFLRQIYTIISLHIKRQTEEEIYIGESNEKSE